MRSGTRLAALWTRVLVLSCAFGLGPAPGPAEAGAAAVTRGPYLQLGTHDGIVVRWRTDIPTDSRVSFGDAPGALATDVDDATPAIDHAVALTGLTADTRYYYSIGTTTGVLAGDDADHFFETSPTPGTLDETRIWVLGDSGTGDASAIAVRDAYLAHSAGRHTDLWLMLGDNAYDLGADAEYQAKLFDIFPATLRQSVLWPTLGNHDAIAADSATQTGPYYEIFTLPMGAEAGGVASTTEAYYAFDHGNIHFVVLDSQETPRGATDPMAVWLAADLAATTQDWIIAFWHHPPYSAGSHVSDVELELMEMRQSLVPILEDHGVDLVLTGHSHSYERSFLIDGHYGTSDTFGPAFVLDGGDGREEGTGAYEKPSAGPTPHEGTVYTVAGCSGSLEAGTLDHPAMFVSLLELGSLVLDVAGNRLDLTFLTDSGVIQDHFTLRKGLDCPLDPNDDTDGDTVCGDVDNCPDIFNPDQADGDTDGVGDACEGVDTDGDGVPDGEDCAPTLVGVSSPPGPIGDTLLVNKTDGTTLSWLRAVQGHTSNVYQGTRTPGQSLGGASCLVAETPVVELVDHLPVPTGTTAFYLVQGRNACADGSLGQDSDGNERTGFTCPVLGLDGDSDGVTDTADNCALLANSDQADADGDFTGDVCDGCPSDTAKLDPGLCGCGTPDSTADGDDDGTPDCNDGCPTDPAKTDPGVCGCAVPDTDFDMDGTEDCIDGCPTDPGKVDPGVCGCGVPDSDFDLDGTEDCIDGCPTDPGKTSPGVCGCGTPDTDSDLDGTQDCIDGCPSDPDKTDPGTCGCGVVDSDGDLDGVADCVDNCPDEPNPDQTDVDGNGVGDACECRETLGETGALPEHDSDDSGKIRVTPIDVDCDGTSVAITGIFRRADQFFRQVIFVVYDDSGPNGGPGILLAQSDPVYSFATANGYAPISTDLEVDVVAGERLWIGFQLQSSSTDYRFTESNGGTEHSYDTFFTFIPNDWVENGQSVESPKKNSVWLSF